MRSMCRLWPPEPIVSVRILSARSRCAEQSPTLPRTNSSSATCWNDLVQGVIGSCFGFLPAAKLSGLRERFSLRCMYVCPSVPFISSLVWISLVSHIGDGYLDIMDIWTSWIFGHHGYSDIMDIQISVFISPRVCNGLDMQHLTRSHATSSYGNFAQIM